MEPLFELPILLPTRGSHEILRALHQQLRAAIVDGRLRPGLRLPSTRALASSHGISRNTAVAAYDLLLSEGYVSMRQGSGCYVAQALSRPAPGRARAGNTGADTRLSSVWRGRRVRRRGAHLEALPYWFRLGTPDTALFPYDTWRRLSNRALRSLSKSQVSRDPQGLPALRDAIAKHVSVSRAVACRPDDVLVTSGAQQAFDLLDPIPSFAGLHVAALLRHSEDAEEVVKRARDRGVGVSSVGRYCIGRPDTQGLIFGYGAIGEQAITGGLSELRHVWRPLLRLTRV